MSKTLTWAGASSRPRTEPLRHAVAALLRTASAVLARAARRMRPVHRAEARLPVIEFHSLHHEAGAPEGALYVDGELVAVLPVGRL